MCPSPECMVTIASDVSSRLFIQREGKVLSIVDDDLKTLIVNDRPEADVSLKVRGYIGEIEAYIESACHVHYLERVYLLLMSFIIVILVLDSNLLNYS